MKLCVGCVLTLRPRLSTFETPHGSVADFVLVEFPVSDIVRE